MKTKTKKPKPESPPSAKTVERLDWKVPYQEKASTADWWVWESECGRYRVVRSTPYNGNARQAGFASCIRRKGQWDILECTTEGPSYAKYRRTLEVALQHVVAYHAERLGEEVLSNSAETVLAAEKTNIDRTPLFDAETDKPIANDPPPTYDNKSTPKPAPNTPPEQGDPAMATKSKKPKKSTAKDETAAVEICTVETIQIPKADALELFGELGFHNADKWNADKWAKSLAKLPKFLAESPDAPELEKLSENAAKTLKAILDADAASQKAEVVQEAKTPTKDKIVDPERNGEAKAGANGKHEGKKPTAKDKPVKAKKEGGRFKILGKYSVGPFLRWLGTKGVNFDGASTILRGEGDPPIKEVSVKWELKETRAEKPPANVEKADATLIREKYPSAFGESKPKKKAKAAK